MDPLTDEDRPKPATDPTLATLFATPFAVHQPRVQTVPFVFASPHSGRDYPASFIARSRLGARTLRRSEDAFVDDLFACAIGLGAPLIAAHFPRAYLDANRGATELDITMFHGALDCAVEVPGPRVQSGLGVIPRIVRDGAEIYRERLAPGEARERLEKLYIPYHAAIEGLLAQTCDRFGFAVLIDCHSMPSAAAVPDIIIGDRYGVSAAPQLTHATERALEMQAFTVGRNAPYAGGYTTHRYGRRAGPVQALQIEINRGLYMDEERVTRGPRYTDIVTRIGDAMAALTAMTSGQPAMRLTSPPLAAE